MIAIIIRIAILWSLCASSFLVGAQETYVWCYAGNDQSSPSYYEMYKVDILSGERALLFRIDSIRFVVPSQIGIQQGGLSFKINSFAFSEDKTKIYFLEEEGDLYVYDIQTDQLTYIKDLTPKPSNVGILWHGYTTTIQIDQINDSLYHIGGNTIGTLNVNTFEFALHSQPPNHPDSFLPYWLNIAELRTIKHKDKFIYYSVSRDIRIANIYEPEKHELFVPINRDTITITNNNNLISYQYSCDSVVLYITTDTYFAHPDSITLFSIDEVSGKLTKFKSIKDFIILPNVNSRIFDIQHYNATSWESCQRYIDLDLNDSTVEGIDFRYDSICSYAAAPLSDLDIKIRNEYPIDSLVIELIAPTSTSLDINIPLGNYDVTSTNPKWRIINNGTTSVADYMNAIRNASLNNLAQVNEVTLQFTVWYDSIGGNPAITTLVFPSSLPNAGADNTRTYCEGDTALTILKLPSNEADLGGTFYDANFNIITNLESVVAPYDGIIYYVASNGICYDTSQIDLSVRPIPTLVGLEDVVICSDSEYTAEINVENNASLTWSDGNLDRTRMFTEAGTYTYQITNQYGCIDSDTFTISKFPPATSMTTDVQICDGETFTYMEKVYDAPGNFTDTIINVYGCDSIIFRLNLGIYPSVPIVLAGDLSLCEGSSTTISIESPHNQLMLDNVSISSPITLTESGDFLITGTDQNGCITEKEISITMHPNPEVFTLDIIDTIFVPGLALPVTYDGDIDTYRWSPSISLDCADCPYPTLLAATEGIYTISIEDKNGCKNEAQLRVSFLDSKLYVPNIISNHASDPENQVFYVKGNNADVYTLSVYDRWGNQIFYRKDAAVNNRDDGWSPRGKVVSGVYVYLISYKDKGKEKTLYGSITVLD